MSVSKITLLDNIIVFGNGLNEINNRLISGISYLVTVSCLNMYKTVAVICSSISYHAFTEKNRGGCQPCVFTYLAKSQLSLRSENKLSSVLIYLV